MKIKLVLTVSYAKMCPACCPMNQEENQFKLTLFPICRTYAGPKIIQRCLTENVNSNFIHVPITNERIPETESTIPVKTKTKGVCKFYLRNRCKNGKNCSWEHPNVCFSWTKNGICKNKENVKNIYIRNFVGMNRKVFNVDQIVSFGIRITM